MPSPVLSNNLGLRSQVQTVRMMSGMTKTYIKRANSKRTHRYVFTVSSEKQEELQDFVRRYRGSQVRAVWRGAAVVGYLTLNPVESIAAGRAGGWPGGEAYSVTLEIVEA